MLAFAAGSTCAAERTPAGYPEKPIRLIVGFTPSGSDDYVGRVVGARLSERFGQTVIVDNRPGAGGNVGAEITARANPDGYTLSSVGSITLASSPGLYVKLGYDPIRDFTFISRVAIGANVLFANPTIPAKSVAELVTLARAKPRSISYGTPGIASLGHLTTELLQSVGKLELVHVPYKGAGAAVTAVIGNEVPIGLGAITAAVSAIQAKRMNGLAVTSIRRNGALPAVPTLAESGFPGFDVVNHHGILAPAGTPMPIVRLINAEIQTLLKQEDVRAKFPALGLEAAGSTPEEFTAIVKSELARWTRVIKDANITPN